MSGAPTGVAMPEGEPLPDGGGPDGATLSEVEEIDQRHFDIQNRRADVMLRMIEAADAADKRQYDHGVKQLESSERIARAHLSLAAYIAVGIAVTIILVFLAAFAMFFFGSDEQAGRAQRLLGLFFTALGGGGLFYAAQRGLRWLTRAG